MDTTRLQAFSDGVIAIIITITVLGLRVPEGSGLVALMPLVPTFFIYIFSFQTIGTFWNNHHHLLFTTKELSPGIMWANMHFLFWLSLIPFVTEWLGNNFGAPWPTALYCSILLLASVAYILLERTIIRHQGRSSMLGSAVGQDRKGSISLAGYSLSIVFAFVNTWVSYALIIALALWWFIPDNRIAKNIKKETAV